MDVFDPADEEPPSEDAEQPTRFEHVSQWVEEWLLPHFRRNPKAHAWDPRWWRYEESGAVLEAMWRSWEQSRVDPDPRVMATWFRDVFYPLMGHLTGPDGPFWNFSADLARDDVPASWPVEAPPAEWFD